MSDEFRSDRSNILAMNAITKSEMKGVLVSRDATSYNPHVYSHHIEKEGKATNQKVNYTFRTLLLFILFFFQTTNVFFYSFITNIHSFIKKNKKASGRCWLFATTNVLRLDIMKRYKLDEFEFSQTFIFWYDKLEKSSFFLDSIIETYKEPLDGRLVQHLLTCPVNDGGQWEMAVNVIEKYGLVPKSVFPESAHAGATAKLNWLVTVKLREGAR